MSAEPQVGFRFRLLHPDGRQETLVVDAERALVGSAAHCEVRLPPEIAAHEHLEVVASENTIQFTVREMALVAPPPLLDGQPVTAGYWQPGTPLTLGNVQMFVEIVSLGTPKAKAPVWVFASVAGMVLFTITVVALAGPTNRGDPPIPDAPVLLAPKGTAACPNVAPEQRAALATERQRVALAKREKSPFSPQDGLGAVVDFETAAACFRLAGQAAPAADAEHAADVLRTKIEEDYRIRRVKLEHAYRVHDTNAAKRELVVLIPMTSRNRGPYTDWLAAVNRAVTLELSQRGRLQP